MFGAVLSGVDVLVDLTSRVRHNTTKNPQTATAMEIDPDSEIEEDPQPTTATEIDPTAALPIKRQQKPMNEFEENDKIFYYSFPFVFLRGLKTKGSMPISTSRHLQLQFTGKRVTGTVLSLGHPSKNALVVNCQNSVVYYQFTTIVKWR